MNEIKLGGIEGDQVLSFVVYFCRTKSLLVFVGAENGHHCLRSFKTPSAQLRIRSPLFFPPSTITQAKVIRQIVTF